VNVRAERFDRVVVGAGASGIIAALAAARLGARVALVEAGDRLGGVAAWGLHRFVCGLFTNGGERAGTFLHGEVTRRFCERLAGGPPEKRAVRRGRVGLLPFAGGAAFSGCAAQMLSRETGLRLFLNERVADVAAGDIAGKVVRAARRVEALRLASGRVLEAGAFIDCTGRAAVCRLAGAAVVCPERPALGGYGFEVGGVREGGPLGLSVEVPLALRREVDAGRLPGRFAFTVFEPSEDAGRGWVKLAVPNDTRDEQARADAEAALAVLRRLSAFREAAMTAVTPRVLPRETCRVHGRETLAEADVVGARKRGGGIARDAWPAEHWDADSGVSYRYPPDGDWCDIPAECLMPADGPANVLCAGAALSADSGAAASVRAMGVCMATGEAAGHSV
jgi:hypothetical protein